MSDFQERYMKAMRDAIDIGFALGRGIDPFQSMGVGLRRERGGDIVPSVAQPPATYTFPVNAMLSATPEGGPASAPDTGSPRICEHGSVKDDCYECFPRDFDAEERGEGPLGDEDGE